MQADTVSQVYGICRVSCIVPRTNRVVSDWAALLRSLDCRIFEAQVVACTEAVQRSHQYAVSSKKHLSTMAEATRQKCSSCSIYIAVEESLAAVHSCARFVLTRYPGMPG